MVGLRTINYDRYLPVYFVADAEEDTHPEDRKIDLQCDEFLRL